MKPRVAVTRAEEPGGDGLARAIERLGGVARPFPLIQFAPPADPAPLRECARRLGAFSWIAFTSPRAVEAVLLEARRAGLDPRQDMGGARVAAVGEATASALERHGVRADAIGRAGARELAGELLGDRDLAGADVLVPRAEKTAYDLAGRLREAGAKVTEVVAYRTRPADPAAGRALLESMLRGELDVVTFASGSAVLAFVAAVGRGSASRALSAVPSVCLGATAAARLRAIGAVAARVADRPAIDALAAAAIETAREARPD